MVQNVGIRGKHKIADRWSETIYTVVKRIEDSPVYAVVPKHTDGPEEFYTETCFCRVDFFHPL